MLFCLSIPKLPGKIKKFLLTEGFLSMKALRFSHVLSLPLLLLCSVLSCSSHRLTDDVRDFLPSGQYAPSFSLKDIYGKQHTLEQYRGRLVLLHFWSTWCMSCYDEMYELKKLSAKFSDKAFTILAVSIDDSAAPVRSYQKRHKIPFPVLLDSAKHVQALYYASGIPSSVFIGPQGELLYLRTGTDALLGPVLAGTQDWGSEAIVRAIGRAALQRPSSASTYLLRKKAEKSG